jgi:beta-galactosidase
LDLAAAPAVQDTGSKIYIDASAIPSAPEALAFEAGGRSPDGHTLGINSRYLTLDGKPWFPVMGEFHYSRYPAGEWEDELLKMKAGGIRIVSTYIFWIHHEEVEGQFDWSGQRDLRRFVELAARSGLYVWVRVGPWAHGEVRNGGLTGCWPSRRCGKTIPRICGTWPASTARSAAS